MKAEKWKLFKIKIQYFKMNGKFYTETEFDIKAIVRSGNTCYMPDVVAHVRGLRDNGGPGSMPGLQSFTEGWDGFIWLNCDEGHPMLLLPQEDS